MSLGPEEVRVAGLRVLSLLILSVMHSCKCCRRMFAHRSRMCSMLLPPGQCTRPRLLPRLPRLPRLFRVIISAVRHRSRSFTLAVLVLGMRLLLPLLPLHLWRLAMLQTSINSSASGLSRKALKLQLPSDRVWLQQLVVLLRLQRRHR
jgi:hypothetical protein